MTVLVFLRILKKSSTVARYKITGRFRDLISREFLPCISIREYTGNNPEILIFQKHFPV